MRFNRSFIDRVRLYARGGRGGDGHPGAGGRGGNGGSVWLEAHDSVNMSHVEATSRRLLAAAGSAAGKRSLLGQSGDDLVVKVPPGVTVLRQEPGGSRHGAGAGGLILGDLLAVGDRLCVARGGEGGGPHTGYAARPGQASRLQLDLKLLADVGFVGFPNAGKSTLMRALSRAKPKVAAYPFTTLQPNVGTIVYDQTDGRRVSLADLPGLVEGAHINVGLGHHFLKHVERTSLLLFVVDSCGFQFKSHLPHRSALETILLLHRELELYDDTLLSKPVLLVLNKVDRSRGAAAADLVQEQLQRLQGTDASDWHAGLRAGDIDLPVELLPKRLPRFLQSFPCSALQSQGTAELSERLRFWLDALAEERRESESAQVDVDTEKVPSMV